MKIRHSQYLMTGCLALIPVMQLQGIVLNGSDLINEPIREAILAEAEAQGLDLQLDMQGSLLGRRAFQSESTEASLLAIPDSEQVPEHYRHYPVCYQTVTFAVHDSNPLQELSYEQLARLFGDRDVLENWSELTSAVAWSDRKVALGAARQDHLVSLELFNRVVLEEKPFKRSLKITEAPAQSFRDVIRLDPNVLILLPYTKAVPPVKFLDIKAGESDQSYNPSPANIFYGDYPLRLPFYLLIPETMDREEAKRLLGVLLSPGVSAAMLEQNFVALPDQEKRELFSRFD